MHKVVVYGAASIALMATIALPNVILAELRHNLPTVHIVYWGEPLIARVLRVVTISTNFRPATVRDLAQLHTHGTSTAHAVIEIH
jgi:hypothetical protein